LPPQDAIAVYSNDSGDLVIRQKADWPHSEDDTIIVIAAQNVMTFIDRLCDEAGIPSLGGPERKRSA
jgi:hypothetical protein